VPDQRETLEQSESLRPDALVGPAPTPGLIVIFEAGLPAAIPVPIVDGELKLGRDHEIFTAHPDARVSRQHAVVRCDGHRFTIVDLGSRNGTIADGKRLKADAPTEVTRVIRIGDVLLVPVRNIEPIQRLGVRVANGRVEGPALQEALAAACHAARLGSTLHITGESGAGKEGMARAFHAAAPSSGPFTAVNCATIPEGVAERLLFGAKRGAYSGADADAEGYVQASHGGTLFLDEVAELSLAVQAKLLRVLETGEVLPLGAARPRKVDLRFCSATHRDLRAQVAAGKLREDLFFRIATPRVVVPPLRDRPEEIPWLLRAEIERTGLDLTLHVSMVEACLLRVWPGNARELLAETRSAAQVAIAAGASRVEAAHLSEMAGSAFAAPVEPQAPAPAAVAAPTPAPAQGSPPTRAKLSGVLKRCEGNVSAAARELGVHRTQLRRWMERHGLDARAFAPPGKATNDDEGG
jgi:DNA-binding NtrC family response regulator